MPKKEVGKLGRVRTKMAEGIETEVQRFVGAVGSMEMDMRMRFEVCDVKKPLAEVSGGIGLNRVILGSRITIVTSKM